MQSMAEEAISQQLKKREIRRDIDVDELYLAERDIEDAPDLDRFKNLQRLWLNNNKLRRMGGLQSNYKLTELYLQDNMIKAITGTLQHLTCLQVILLHGNQLTVLTDAIHELRNMQNLKILSLFGNPLSQDYDYRMYVLFCISSLEILDRQEITKDERDKTFKKYEKDRQQVKDSIAFGRRSKGPPAPVYHHSLLENETKGISGISVAAGHSSRAEEVLFNKSTETFKKENESIEQQYSEEIEKRAKQRSVMQFTTFGWFDVVADRKEALNKKSNTSEALIFTTKFK